MKKGLITIIILVVLGLFIYLYFQGMFNKMVTREEGVKEKWAQVENNYQRRLELIPNLVNTVKGAANFEQETLVKVVEARSNATSVKVDPDKLDPESIKKFQEAQQGVTSALSRLLVVVEKYPELKATANFRDLQSQLEGTENRIAVARKDFNEAVKVFNTYIRRFPQNIFAGMYGFEKKGYFESNPGAEKAPEVKF